LKTSLIALGVISILVVVGVSLAVGSATSTSTQTAQPTSTQVSSITATTTSSGNTSSATSVASNGIMLNVTISPVPLASGGSLTITAEIYNTLFSSNNVSATVSWAFPSLVGQCKGGGVDDALYSGYLTASNISSAIPIPWLPPGGLTCPAFSGGVGYYIFSPRSDQLTAYPNSSISATTIQNTGVEKSCSLSNETSTSPNGNFTTTSNSIVFCTTSTMTYFSTTTTTFSSYSFTDLGSYDVSQYYDTNSSSVVNFASGQYSLLVGDSFGSYVILYFTVS
jgi:hypothetical protein